MKIHMCIDIEGVLRWEDKKLNRLFEDIDGIPRSNKYVRKWLKLQLAHGKKFLPMGKCDNFDYQTGCKGHEELI